MNMTLSKRGDYVVRSALALARAWPSGESRKIREVVAEMGVPQTFASQILADLVRAGLATSKAGREGGYRLAHPPDEISLLEVVEAGEGRLKAERCALGDGPCRWDAVCPLHETWRTATEALREVLSRTTLADLVARDVEIEEGRASPPVDSHRHGPTSVEVSDWVYAEASLDAVGSYLRHEGRLVCLVEDSYRAVESLREQLLPEGPQWAPVQAFVTCSRSQRPASAPSDQRGGDTLVRGARASTDGDRQTSFELAWEAVGRNGLASRGELEVDARVVDPERTELRVEGRFRPPGTDAGAMAVDNEAERTRLAQALVRSLLRSLARELAANPGRGSRGAPEARTDEPSRTSRGSIRRSSKAMPSR
jgi:Rrf2 family protein